MKMIIALISDIHGNYPALEAVMENPNFKRADKAYCLGDLVGYYPYPEECTLRIREERIACIMGNHDHSCVENKPCRSNRVGIASLELTRKLVSHQSIDFLSKLPEEMEIELGGRGVCLVHGSPEDHLNGYVYPEDNVVVPPSFDILAMGHTHIPFSRKQYEKLVVNPGSVGQPRDGSKGACFALLDLEECRVVLSRVDYDISEVLEKTEAAGCCEAADALRRTLERDSHW